MSRSPTSHPPLAAATRLVATRGGTLLALVLVAAAGATGGCGDGSAGRVPESATAPGTRAAALATDTAPSPAAAARSDEPPRFPGAPVVLISIDTLRSDHLPAYGYRGVDTPAIDALRRDAILFSHAYSQVPLTLPAHATMLTGLLPAEHGVRDNGGYPYAAAALPHLPRLLGDAGYQAAAFVSSFVLHADTGLAAGFATYDQGYPGRQARAELLERRGLDTVAAAIAWLRRQRGTPFFLFVHLFDPHTPYRPPEPFATIYRDRPYDGEVAAADAAVGELLAALRALGLYEPALILLVSDHGEGLGDHGEQGHGILLYREVLQVPLLLKLPGGRRAGETVGAPAQLADLAPTVLALTGQPVPPQMRGTSLLALAGQPPRPIYGETLYPRLHLGWSELTSVIDGRHHYLHGPTPELFDLVADPAERHDVLAQQRRVYHRLRSALAGFPQAVAPPRPLDVETARRLTALGYAGSGRLAAGPLPDPRTRRDAIRDLQVAGAALNAGRCAEAASLLEALVTREPTLLDAWAGLGQCREQLGHGEPALAAYRRALELSQGAPEHAFYVARLLYRLGRFDEAARHAELMLAGDPGNADAHQMLAAVALGRGDLDRALSHSRAAGRMSPIFRRDLARALEAQGRSAEAAAVRRAGAAGDSPS